MFNLEGKVQKNLSNNETNFIIPNNCVVVCPWIIRNGFQNISENGFLPANADPYWYGFFQKVFTGNQVITATWENSTYLTKVENAFKFAYNFQVGKYYTGAIVVGTAEYSTEIEPMSGNEDFLSMKNNSSVTIRFQNWVPNEKDMYKLYTIPDLYGGKWYYISSVKVLNDLQSTLGRDSEYSLNDTSIPAVEITFTSLVDKLQVSGKAVEQYVQYAGVGEPYIVPLVVEYNANTGSETNTWVEPSKYVTYIPYEPTSANYLQVELQGCNAISAIEVEGRSLTYENNQWVSTPWKRLLAHDTVANQVNELNRTSLPSRNFYYFPNTNLDFVTSKQFQEDNKTREDALAMNQSAGKLKLGATGDWINKATGQHKSNPTTTEGVHYDYNNNNWKPTSWTSTTYNFDTSGNYYCENQLSITTNDSFVDIINKNSFIYETQPLIPLGFYSCKPYHISSIPIIGKIVSKFWGDITINPHTTQRQPLNLGLFIDCDVAGMLANIYSSEQDNSVWAPLNALVGDETKASKYLGTTALNTTLTFSLTDKISENGTMYDTIYFGQKKKEDNTTDILTGGATYYYGRANQITQPKDANSVFVIDTITVYALHKGKIKLTAYNTLTNPIWTTTIQSKANWTNSIRDWATTIMCGGWDADYCNFSESDFPWPARPDKVSGYEIAINHNNIWALGKTTTTTERGVTIYTNGVYKNTFENISYYDQRQTYRGMQYYGAKWLLQPRTTNISVNYASIDPTITTKAQFKNKFSSMELPITGYIYSENLPKLNTDTTRIISIGSADTYTETLIVGQLGDQVTGVTYPKLACNDSSDIKKLMNGGYWAADYSGRIVPTGGFTTLITYTITLGDSAISIAISENDYCNQWGEIEIDPHVGTTIYYGSFIAGQIASESARQRLTTWIGTANNLGANVKVPKLKLIER